MGDQLAEGHSSQSQWDNVHITAVELILARKTLSVAQSCIYLIPRPRPPFTNNPENVNIIKALIRKCKIKRRVQSGCPKFQPNYMLQLRHFVVAIEAFSRRQCFWWKGFDRFEDSNSPSLALVLRQSGVRLSYFLSNFA
jgi:hypothetical protein